MSRLALVITLVVSVNAQAANENAVAVLDIQGAGIPAELLPTLTEVLTVEISELGLYKVIAGRDIQSMLGFERQKDVLGCTDTACLAEIGGALGVERIVASHIGMVGSTYVVNIKLINIRMANTEARVYETVRGEVDTLLNTVRKSVQKLLGPESRAALARRGAASPPPSAVVDRQPVTPEPATTTPPVAPSPEPVSQQPVTQVETSRHRGIGIAPWIFWGIGALALGAGGVTGISALKEADLANKVSEPGSQVAAVKAPELARRANTLLVLGGVCAVGGFAWMWFFGDSGSTTALTPVVGNDHYGMAATTEF